MMKKLLSLFFALCLIVSAFTLIACEPLEDISGEEEQKQQAQVPDDSTPAPDVPAPDVPPPDDDCTDGPIHYDEIGRAHV